jgi:chitosanase
MNGNLSELSALDSDGRSRSLKLTKIEKNLIVRVVNVFETGKPEGNYGMLVVMKDCPHKIPQITYGRSQTTEYGLLRDLVQRYVAGGGIFSAELAPFANEVGSKPLTNNTAFRDLLRRAGREDPVMQRVQDQFFDERYFKPAMQWADQQKFTLPLSALVIYDSFVHSGGILWLLRSKFAENPPSLGGDEKAWVKAYTNTRNNWLANHPNKLLHKTIYRTECFKREIGRDNWSLSKAPIKANGVNVTA